MAIALFFQNKIKKDLIMKTAIFEFLLRKLAKQLMSEADYGIFQLRMYTRRWQEFRTENPNLWEWFSEKYEQARDLFTPNSNPEEAFGTIVPGPITHCPELFRPFLQDLTIPGSSFSGYALDFSEVNFSGVDIAGINLSELDISGIDESYIEAGGADLAEVFTDLWESIFS
jgi:hypothetical protein